MYLNISGPVFSIITPFNKKERIDYRSLRKLIKFYYNRGAKIFYLMPFNSRLGLLNETEIIELNSNVIKFVKNLDKNNIVITSERYEGSTFETIQTINNFFDRGADINAIIFGEKFYSNEQVINHFKTINKKSNGPLLLHLQYLINGMSANPLTVDYNLELIKKISKLKKIIAIKEDIKKANLTKKILKITKSKQTVIKSGGGMEVFMNLRKYGCKSWLVGIGCVDPKISVDFYNELKNKNYDFCNKIIKLIERPFFKMVFKFGWHITIKTCLNYMKLMEYYERRPLMELPKKSRDEINKQMKKFRKISLDRLSKDYFKPLS